MVLAYLGHPPPHQNRCVQEEAPEGACPIVLCSCGPAADVADAQVPLERSFPEYAGGDDVNKAAKYILWRFLQTNRARLSVYPQYVLLALFFPFSDICNV